MTGLHTGHSQIRGNEEIAPEGQQPMLSNTFAIGKLMQESGYTTGILGKWGLDFPPRHRFLPIWVSMSFMDTIANVRLTVNILIICKKTKIK